VNAVSLNREHPSPPPPFWRFLVAAVIYLIITNVAVFIVAVSYTHLTLPTTERV